MSSAFQLSLYGALAGMFLSPGQSQFVPSILARQEATTKPWTCHATQDAAHETPLAIEETFADRQDCLAFRSRQPCAGWAEERFSPGAKSGVLQLTLKDGELQASPVHTILRLTPFGLYSAESDWLEWQPLCGMHRRA